jgi:hypothetical protein
MVDDRLLDVIERWDELGWYDRKRIRWRLIKVKYCINGKHLLSLATATSIIGVLIGEQNISYKTGLLSTIVLSYFYFILLDYLVNKPAGIMEIAPDGTIISTKGGKFLGWHKRDLVGNCAHDMKPRTSEKEKQMLAEIVQTGQPRWISTYSKQGIPIKNWVKPVYSRQGEFEKLVVSVYPLEEYQPKLA